MAYNNNITIVGRLTRDPEMRRTQGGDPVCSLSIAVDKLGKDNGADFFNVSLFGRGADSASQYLAKGKWVSVTGSMVSRKDDQGKVWWSVKGDNWGFVGAKPADTSQPDRQAVEVGARASGRWQDGPPDDDDDQIPPF